MKRLLACAMIAGLSACGSSEPGPGDVTANEAKALDEAAEMIESRRLDESAVQNPVTGASSAAASAIP